MILELLAAGVVGGLIAGSGRRTTEYRTIVLASRDPNYGVAPCCNWVPPRRRHTCLHDMDRRNRRCRNCGETAREIATVRT
jgi:hypothetical protein